MLYQSDRLTREFLSGGYFSSEEIFKKLDRYLQKITRAWFLARLQRKTCPYVSRRGRITRAGRQLFTEIFSEVPAPFLERLRARLQYISMLSSGTQQEFIRVSQVVSALRDKGCDCLGAPKPYTRHVEFDQVADLYVQYRHSLSYTQDVLQALGIIHIHKARGAGGTVPPISETKQLAIRKKGYFDFLNRDAQRLSQEERQAVVRSLAEGNADLPLARRMVQNLSQRLETADFADAWRAVCEEYLPAQAAPALGELHVGPNGLVSRDGQQVDTILSRDNGTHGDKRTDT